MRDKISKILIKWSMPTRQTAISEIVAFCESMIKKTEQAFGGCTLCYGKGYSTTIEQHKEEGHGPGISVKTAVFCTCERGKQLDSNIEILIKTVHEKSFQVSTD